MGTIGNATQQLVDILASPTETKFCDIHRYSLVKDVHGAALSTLTFIYCLCFMIRAMANPRSSKTFRWLCQSQTVMTLLATANHVFGRKYNDVMFVTWSVFVSGQAKLDLYEERGGAWYYQVVPRNVHKYARLLTILAILDPRYAPLCFALFVCLPQQPKKATVTSRMADVFLFFSLAPILYELINEGRCPYGFPVHALSDASVFFVNVWSLMHFQDVDLEKGGMVTNGKKDWRVVNVKKD